MQARLLQALRLSGPSRTFLVLISHIIMVAEKAEPKAVRPRLVVERQQAVKPLVVAQQEAEPLMVLPVEFGVFARLVNARKIQLSKAHKHVPLSEPHVQPEQAEQRRRVQASGSVKPHCHERGCGFCRSLCFRSFH